MAPTTAPVRNGQMSTAADGRAAGPATGGHSRPVSMDRRAGCGAYPWPGPTTRTSSHRPARPHALAAHESTVVAAVTGDVIVASTDGGATWTRRYSPR